MNRQILHFFIFSCFIIVFGAQVSEVAAQGNLKIPTTPVKTYPKDPVTGFPGGYEESPQCVSMFDVAEFKYIFVRNDAPASLKTRVAKAMAADGHFTAAADSTKADLLVDIRESPGNSVLNLWALKSRPSIERFGVRCNIMPNSGRNVQPLIDDMFKYLSALRIKAGQERAAEAAKNNDGFPDGAEKPKSSRSMGTSKVMKDANGIPSTLGPGNSYEQVFSCQGYISEEEMRGFSKVFISTDAPVEMRAKMAKALNESGYVTVVEDSLQADYVVFFEYGAGTNTEVTRTPGTVTTMGGEVVGVEEGKTTVSRTPYEVSSVTVGALKHPVDRGSKGVLCASYYKSFGRPTTLLGKALVKNPVDRIINDLVKYVGRFSAKKKK